MILNINSDASYLSESQTRSSATGYFYLGDVPTDGKLTAIKGPIYVMCGILKFVVTLAAEAELGALFLNCKEGKILQLTLEEMGHPQPPTPVHVDYITAVGIANDSVKKQRSRSMEMRFFWVTDQVKNKQYLLKWHPGMEYLADYITKQFTIIVEMGLDSRAPWYFDRTN